MASMYHSNIWASSSALSPSLLLHVQYHSMCSERTDYFVNIRSRRVLLRASTFYIAPTSVLRAFLRLMIRIPEHQSCFFLVHDSEAAVMVVYT